MSAPLLFALPGNEPFTAQLAARLGAEIGEATVRQFPDGESYVRVDGAVDDRDVALVWTMRDPDRQLAAVGFFARTVAELGAARVGLVAPYLAYLRQDRRFRQGEALTSALFAADLSRWFSWMVTVEPHLHRVRSLAEIYRLDAGVVRVADEVADWIRRNVAAPLLIGPDVESAQWVDPIARCGHWPHALLEKRRSGDRDVAIAVPDSLRCNDRTPVLIDDIIGSAHTMIEAVRALRAREPVHPICLGMHAVFGAGAEQALSEAGAGRVVTTNTIAHPTNGIDVASAVAAGVRARLAAAVPCAADGRLD